jgi:hypothetical protein
MFDQQLRQLRATNALGFKEEGGTRAERASKKAEGKIKNWSV